MSNTEIDQFLDGLRFTENPWADRAYEPAKPMMAWPYRLGVHCMAAAFGLVLGTLVWQVFVYVTVADLVMATAAVK